ncbi:MAG: endopeptidase La [Bacteroidales bacterium]|jgi:ATP-dependent Lon protease|nr:endopeptidase La [Bacteroidales bacterium]
MNNLLNLSEFIETETDFIPIFSPENADNLKNEPVPKTLPILPLRNTVLYPGIVMPITVGRDKAKELIKNLHGKKQYLGVVAQRDKNLDKEINFENLFDVATMGVVVQTIQMPDDSTMVIIQGVRRIKIDRYLQTEPYFIAEVSPMAEEDIFEENEQNSAIISSIKDLAKQIINKSPHIPNDMEFVIKNIRNTNFLINFVASMLESDGVDKQRLLESSILQERTQILLELLTHEQQRVDLKQQIQGKVRSSMDKTYREHILNEQLKTIQQELGGSQVDNDVKELKEKAKNKKWSSEVAEIFEKELKKLQRLHSMSPDYSTQLNYLSTVVELPWNEYTNDNFDLKHAQNILDADHFGLEKVKQRIIEHVAVLKLKGDLKAPILCLFGPPGVGKTSLGKSLAGAIERKYIRISLGGLRDESEIRGHRRTYIGAMPGRIISNLKRVKSANPVFVLDEIDKILGMNIQGDPSAALLEVLDPEQNTSFHDNFLDIDFDLSKVLFVATANTLGTIHPALLDRMEIIDIAGYIIEEKIEIAKRHLVTKQLCAHGVEVDQFDLSEELIREIIEKYTREAGVRQLDKQIAKLVRHRARQIAEKKKYSPKITFKELEKSLGAFKFDKSQGLEENFVGVVTGLAWTAVGGEILFIEASLSIGKGQLTMTGNLGDVMKESATLAFEYLKSNAKKFGIDEKLFETRNVHIHVPEGATPKDGPSAGVAMFTALSSVFLNKKVKSDFAMTGEITLRGQVLPVGGIKEKILAAKRAKIENIILCKDNKRHVEEIEKEYLKGLNFYYIDKMNEVLNLAL